MLEARMKDSDDYSHLIRSSVGSVGRGESENTRLNEILGVVPGLLVERGGEGDGGKSEKGEGRGELHFGGEG